MGGDSLCLQCLAFHIRTRSLISGACQGKDNGKSQPSPLQRSTAQLEAVLIYKKRLSKIGCSPTPTISTRFKLRAFPRHFISALSVEANKWGLCGECIRNCHHFLRDSNESTGNKTIKNCTVSNKFSPLYLRALPYSNLSPGEMEQLHSQDQV